MVPCITGKLEQRCLLGITFLTTLPDPWLLPTLTTSRLELEFSNEHDGGRMGKVIGGLISSVLTKASLYRRKVMTTKKRLRSRR